MDWDGFGSGPNSRQQINRRSLSLCKWTLEGDFTCFVLHLVAVSVVLGRTLVAPHQRSLMWRDAGEKFSRRRFQYVNAFKSYARRLLGVIYLLGFSILRSLEADFAEEQFLIGRKKNAQNTEPLHPPINNIYEHMRVEDALSSTTDAQFSDGSEVPRKLSPRH